VHEPPSDEALELELREELGTELLEELPSLGSWGELCSEELA
jgi:hypothetical protein